MADQKISELDAVTLPAAADLIAIVDDPSGTAETKNITHDDLLFGANGTPSTQAHGDSAAIGSALDAARADHKHAMPSAGGGAITREGGDTTEATTTSTSATELTAITSLTIAATTPFEIEGDGRKSSGNASNCAIDIRINATILGPKAGGGSGSWTATSTNEAQDGGFTIRFGSRVTNYLNSGMASFETRKTSNAIHVEGFTPAVDALELAIMPNAEVTDVDTMGICANTSNTLGVDEQHIYSWATS